MVLNEASSTFDISTVGTTKRKRNFQRNTCGTINELSKSLSQSRDLLDQNDIFTLSDDKSKETAELSPPQARLNMGVFGDFNVNVIAPSTISVLSGDDKTAKQPQNGVDLL